MNTLGFLTLIPLFFIYLLLNKSKKHKAILKLLKERNLDQNSHQQSK
jgi:predicted PurR-regulated permease PerM